MWKILQFDTLYNFKYKEKKISIHNLNQNVMPPYQIGGPGWAENSKRRGILREFSSKHEEMWGKMRQYQTSYNDAVNGNFTLIVVALLFSIVGIMIGIKCFIHYKQNDLMLLFFLVFFAGLCWLIFYLDLKSKRKEIPDLKRKIRELKSSPEIKEVLAAFKKAGVAWTKANDETSLY